MGDIPSARARGGGDDGRRRWLTRVVVVIDRKVDYALAGQCACCCGTIPRGGGAEYCRRCRWHQRAYLLAVVALFGGCGWLGWHAGGRAFEVAPFAGKPLHAALTFLLAIVAPLVVVGVANLLRADPRHGHWGKTVFRRGEGSGARTGFRQPSYGRALAAQVGLDGSAREVREPRSGWRIVAAFLAVIPTASAARAFVTYDRNHIKVYVDNRSDRDVVIAIVNRGEVASVASGQTRVVRLPRAPMTLTATSAGAEVERVTIGGLDEILAGDYPDMFPDIEDDVGDVFIWNVLSKGCYRSSTKTYGTLSFGSEPTIHREKTFLSTAEVPFEAAPSAVRSELPMDYRDELIRVPCE